MLKMREKDRFHSRWKSKQKLFRLLLLLLLLLLVQEIVMSDAAQFLVLFRDERGCQFRALYAMEDSEVWLILGDTFDPNWCHGGLEILLSCNKIKIIFQGRTLMTYKNYISYQHTGNSEFLWLKLWVTETRNSPVCWYDTQALQVERSDGILIVTLLYILKLRLICWKVWIGVQSCTSSPFPFVFCLFYLFIYFFYLFIFLFPFFFL